MNNRRLHLFVVLAGLLILTGLEGYAQRMTPQEYVEKYSKWAVAEMKRTGIPASITLAQGMLESGTGNSTLAKDANNHFGIKCHSEWTGEKIFMDDDAKGECFRNYPSVYDSYIDHSNFLRGRDRYASLFELETTDYKNWAHGLKKAGYATDPNYANKVIKYIEDYPLSRYDFHVDASDVAADDDFGNTKSTSGKGKSDDFVINMGQNHQVKYNNGVAYIEVGDNDTFESISQEFGMRAWEIYRYNDIASSDNIKKYKYLYVKFKRNKSHPDHEVHQVKKGETMHYLSQKYGVKLKRLYKYNNLTLGTEPQAGEKLNLRKVKK